MVIDLVLKFNDDKQRVLDFAINSLGNFILILFASGQTQFLDVDVLKRNYDKEMPEYLVEGQESHATKLPSDDLARLSGIVTGNTFKKVSKFKTEYFEKARESLKISGQLPNQKNNENQDPNLQNNKNGFPEKSLKDEDLVGTGTQLAGTLFTWAPTEKLNGVVGSLCDQNRPPKFGLIKLKNFLRKYGGFPDEMRLAIWGYLLSIPKKKNAFEQLKFLGEYKGQDASLQDTGKNSFNESLKGEILKWKSKWNLTNG
jgi:hypothetical protein